MEDRLFSFQFVSGCLVWVPIAIWIVAMIGWMIQGEIDPLWGGVSVLLAFGLGALAWSSPNPRVAPLVLVASLSLVLLFPFIRSARVKRQLAKLDIEAMERAYEMLGQKKDNVGAKLKIARTLHARGSVAHAVAVAEEALKTLPAALFEEEHRMIKSWKRHMRGAEADEVLCIQCGASNQPGRLYCRRCRAPVMLHYAKGTWISVDVAKKVLGAWIAAVICVVGIPISNQAVPGPGGWVVAGFLVLGAGFIVWSVFKPASKESAA